VLWGSQGDSRNRDLPCKAANEENRNSRCGGLCQSPWRGKSRWSCLARATSGSRFRGQPVGRIRRALRDTKKRPRRTGRPTSRPCAPRRGASSRVRNRALRSNAWVSLRALNVRCPRLWAAARRI